LDRGGGAPRLDGAETGAGRGTDSTSGETEEEEEEGGSGVVGAPPH